MEKPGLRREPTDEKASSGHDSLERNAYKNIRDKLFVGAIILFHAKCRETTGVISFSFYKSRRAENVNIFYLIRNM